MNRISRIFILAFILFWMIFVFADYWQKHIVYSLAIQYFNYWGLALFLLILGAGVTWMVLKIWKSTSGRRFINGLSVFALFLLISVASVGFAYNNVIKDSTFQPGMAGHLIGLLVGTALAVYLITTAVYVLGHFINLALRIVVQKKDSMLINFASGTMGLVLFLFLLGAFSILHAFAVIPALVVLFLLGRKEALVFFRQTLWEPVPLSKKLNVVGIGSFYLLLCLMGMNFTSVNVPMPAGFDALTLYATLPSLIGQHHSLVEGFQPYNWSLLMSLGYVLFDATPVSLAISWLGGTLSLYAMYVLCRNWLKIDVNYSILALLVFALTPAFTIQASAELKVDLGLLFVYLCIVIVMLNYIRGYNKKKINETKYSFFNDPVIILMGLLTGFALGIKLTTVYFAFALVIALWYVQAGVRGFFATFLMCMFLIFFFRIDDFGGLRQYHLGVDQLQWGVLAAALLLLAGVYAENKTDLLRGIRKTLIYGLFAIFSFLPWMAKNYIESGSLSPRVLLNGIDASPEINFKLLEPNSGQ